MTDTMTMTLPFHLGQNVVVTSELRYQQGLVGRVVDIEGAMTDEPRFWVDFDPYETMASLSDFWLDSDDEAAGQLVSALGSRRHFYASELRAAE
jgi:hypothetical protein